MKALAMLMIPLTALATAAAAQKVETGVTDWNGLVPARIGINTVDYSRLVRWTAQELKDPACRKNGWRPDNFEIEEPYAVLLEPDGTVRRIIVKEMGCPALDTVVGSTLVDMARRGKFKPTGQPEPLWFGGRLSFAVSEAAPR